MSVSQFEASDQCHNGVYLLWLKYGSLLELMDSLDEVELHVHSLKKGIEFQMPEVKWLSKTQRFY